MAVVGSKFSSVAGPAKWFGVGVVGTAGIAASIWAYSSRSQAPTTRAEKPSSVVVAMAPTTNASNQEAENEKAFEPVLVARDVNADPIGDVDTNKTADTTETSVDVSMRPMIVHRSKIGPGVFEALPAQANAQEGSSVGSGSFGIFPTRNDLIPMRAPQNDAKSDGAGPTVETESEPKKNVRSRNADKIEKSPSETDKPKNLPRDSKTPTRIGKLIDVNSATQAELELLPDVGPALAKRIIEYRTKHGAFVNLASLDKVTGVGPKTLEKLKDRVTFGKVK